MGNFLRYCGAQFSSIFVCILIVNTSKGIGDVFFSSISKVALVVCEGCLSEYLSSATLSGATLWSCWPLWFVCVFFSSCLNRNESQNRCRTTNTRLFCSDVSDSDRCGRTNVAMTLFIYNHFFVQSYFPIHFSILINTCIPICGLKLLRVCSQLGQTFLSVIS